jgi:hypothetical protein
MEALSTVKAALDAGLLEQADYDKAKVWFVRLQQVGGVHSLPAGVRVVTCTMLAVFHWCFLPCALLGLPPLPGVRLVTWTKHTGCHRLMF